MNVKLISYTQPTEDLVNLNITGIPELIAYCARVSNPDNQTNTETYNKLLAYLIKNAHWSPFELVSVCLEIETTRDIARQILRHRSFSFNEYSQRYADPTQDLSFVLREARFQDTKNRQNSVELEDSEKNNLIKNEWLKRQSDIIELVKQSYSWAIDNGIAKEQARVILPEGNTMSRLYMNGTLRSWIHFIELRSGNGTQKEHREVAICCAKVISEIFPMANSLIDK